MHNLNNGFKTTEKLCTLNIKQYVLLVKVYKLKINKFVSSKYILIVKKLVLIYE